MDTARTARIFLGLNAAFSLLMGVGFLIAPGGAAGMLFQDPAPWQPVVLRLLGGGLILFGLGLVLLVRDRFLTAGQVVFVSGMDAGWILGSAGLLILAGPLFSEAGQGAVVAVAGIVAVFAIGQYLGARRIVPPLSEASVTVSEGRILARVRRAVGAPTPVVWQVMSDHPGYADVARNLSKVEVVAGEGLGMRRRCFGPKGENWQETCDLYEEGRAFGFRVHTEAADYPYPIADLHGVWSVEEEDGGAAFTIHIEAVPKGSVLTRALFRLAARRQFRAVLADLAEAWAARDGARGARLAGGVRVSGAHGICRARDMPEPAVDPAAFRRLAGLAARLPVILSAPKQEGRPDPIVTRPALCDRARRVRGDGVAA
ncbi:SRPBCC family protein [Ovoidimarina sediminis]|uniref:SRPBCC family protein n=1 Tax=Ovoidimarina sediminis TaxID=3079856 RepID=UPI00290A5611|nr:SRPBCC family protein [Rhodophyticola sp. MJ-SS7]MDU8941873.1 SRPBCC family protein [Rhodophyticola sp. MJ-SS7]